MDTGYSTGNCADLEDGGTKAYIPLRPVQEDTLVGTGGFVYQGITWFVRKARRCIGVGSTKDNSATCTRRDGEDCQECPIKNECLPPRQRRRYVSLTRYYPMSLLARKRNQTDEYPRERVRRQTIAEGAFASLDRLG